VTRRQRDIVCLLRSLDPSDGLSPWDYAPATATGLLRRRAAPGEVASRKVVCPECRGEGVRRDRFGREAPCAWCSSRGWYEIDDYTERRIGSARTAETTIACRTVTCDRCGGTGRERWRREGHVLTNWCELCNGSGRLELTASEHRAVREHLNGSPAEPGSGDPVIDAIERRDERGDYSALRAALEELRLEHPRVHQAVVHVYVQSRNGISEGDLRLRVGLRYLDVRLPDPLKVPAAARAAERRRSYAARVARRAARNGHATAARTNPAERASTGPATRSG
jgi:hypothetical protein